MAVISVPHELRARLGDAATDSLVDLLHQFGGEQREDLIAVVEERFARHVAETRDTLRSEMHAALDALRAEMHAGFMDVQKQFLQQQQLIGNLRADVSKEIGNLRADVSKEIGDLRKEIGDVRKEITVQTRWLLTVLVAATILIPVMQRVLAALFS